jgi:hypothetical protein
MPERLEIRYVERSSREIESSRAAAADAVERIKADTGVAISSIRVDPPTNRVVIAVDALTPAKEALLRTRLGGSYASEQKTDAKPEQRQETRSDSPGQLKGGLEIEDLYSRCTSGFVSRDRSSGRYFLLTAGHCERRDKPRSDWIHGYYASGFPTRATIGRVAWSYQPGPPAGRVGNLRRQRNKGPAV